MSKAAEQDGILSWRKSKYSVANGACTEVAATPGSVMVRDSLSRSAVQLRFASQVWREFTARVKDAP
jgi:Domain of unknown function (DUF397)